jgi:hypothetical protein
MTKLEELKDACDVAYEAAWDVYFDEVEILCASGRRSGKSYALAAWVAYKAELKKQEENPND